MKKMLLLGTIICALTTSQVIAQVTGSGTPYYYSQWTGFGSPVTVLKDALLWDDGTTVNLGSVPFGSGTPWNYMYIQGNSFTAAGRSTGINAELLGVAPSGTGQGVVVNIQDNQSNVGINSYTANGISSTAGLFAAAAATEQLSNTVQGIQSSATGNASSTQAYGGNFSALNGISNVAVNAQAQAMNHTLYNTGVSTFATSNGFNATSYGIYASITNASAGDSNGNGSFAGYFNASTNNGGNGAGFFSGNVWYTGTLAHTSDKKFKENINALDDALEIINRLRSKTYTFKNSFKSFNFDQGKQYGFIAQELEEVLPELVNNGVNPTQFDEKGNKVADAVEFKAVEYVQLIPILTAGIQEQQVIIESQNTRIEKLEEQVQKLLASTTSVSAATDIVSGAELYQNIPNPFKGYTTIGYRLPDNTTNARIVVLDMTGKQIKSVQLDCCDNTAGEVNIEAYDLSSGMYLYSLMVNGAEVVTKRMVIK